MNILIVEDNEAEQLILREAFTEVGLGHSLHTVRDGVQALQFLAREGVYSAAVKPDLIVLDLNMPRKNGVEVLTELKKTAAWQHIPVLIFSNSEYGKDICRCYAMGVNAYVNKPADFQGFVELAHAIDSFWFKQVRYCAH